LANFRVDLCVHRQVVIGSPAVLSSTNAWSWLTTAGSFFFQGLAPTPRSAYARCGAVDAAPQVVDATANGRAAQSGNVRKVADAAETTPQGQQTGEQASLAFVQESHDTVNGGMVRGHVTQREPEAIGTSTFIHAPAEGEVNHDRNPPTLKPID